ncbi:MAG: hypothetical protein JWN72_2119 [Thermoleophilia bacterium]|nr:hypothetical protein [Thermoleophilia bacterium]
MTIGAISSAALPRIAAPAASTIAPSAPTLADQYPLSGNALTDRVMTELRNSRTPLTLDQAVSRMSASISFDPTAGAGRQPTVPGSSIAIDAANGFGAVSSAQAAQLSTADFLARSQSVIAASYASGIAADADGNIDTSRLGSMAATLHADLQPDASGMNKYDAKVMALTTEAAQLKASMAGRTATTADLAALSRNLVEQMLVQKEREKKEDLLKLVISLLLGQLPSGVIARLRAAGMGNLVDQLIEAAIGSGKGASRALMRAVKDAVQNLGVSVHVIDEHYTDEGMRDTAAHLAQTAVTTADGRAVDAHGSTVALRYDPSNPAAGTGAASAPGARAGATDARESAALLGRGGTRA